MLYALILAGCSPKEEPSTDSAPPLNQEGVPPCVETVPVDRPLDWTAPSASGLSADDVFGFVVGEHTATLTWDDGTTSDATLTVTPGSAVETTVGTEASCPVALAALARWRLATADRRVDIVGDARWTTADARADQPPGGVVANATLDPAAVNLPRSDPASSMYLRSFLDGDGALVSVVVEEVWPLTIDTNRVCVRGSLDAAAIGCHDTGEGTGPD
jgi:hypothetical protein